MMSALSNYHTEFQKRRPQKLQVHGLDGRSKIYCRNRSRKLGLPFPIHNVEWGGCLILILW